ncbi:hypothetical protein, partial [Klebsiella pneumoniae]|uniref:hypothetical protein n=1 Tax=Klebsiella pneumoniae TaxID=573 RepID=UPI0022351146
PQQKHIKKWSSRHLSRKNSSWSQFDFENREMGTDRVLHKEDHRVKGTVAIRDKINIGQISRPIQEIINGSSAGTILKNNRFSSLRNLVELKHLVPETFVVSVRKLVI